MNLSSLKLGNIEQKVIQARLSGDAVCDIPKPELSILSDVAIFKISAIVGFSLPASEKFADVLNEEFLLFLNDFGYSELTFDEIITAFRINAKGGYRTSGGDILNTVIPYSSFFSINYASFVLENYMRIRRAIDYKIVDCVEERGIYRKYEP